MTSEIESLALSYLDVSGMWIEPPSEEDVRGFFKTKGLELEEDVVARVTARIKSFLVGG